MEYKINYRKNFGPDGTVYDQAILAVMSEKEMQGFNDAVAKRKKEICAKSVKTQEELNFMCYVRFLVKWKNHTTLTMRDFFLSHFGISDKRILDRNTLINIMVVE